MLADYADGAAGGFFTTTDGRSDLVVRLKNAQDGSTPSGNSMAAWALLRLGRLTGRSDLEKAGEGTLRAFQAFLEQAPGAFHQMLLALDLYLGPRIEVVVAGPRQDARTEALIETAQRSYLPRAVLAWTEDQGAGGLLAGKQMVEGRPAAYVCRDMTCDRPVATPEELTRALAAAGRDR